MQRNREKAENHIISKQEEQDKQTKGSTDTYIHKR